MPNVNLAIPSLFVIAACGTRIETMPLRPLSARPRPPLTVEVFTTSPPQRPYYEMARLQAHDPWAPGALQMIGKLRDQAARLGCDGLLIDVPGHHDDAHHLSELAGTCIMFTPLPNGSQSQAPGSVQLDGSQTP